MLALALALKSSERSLALVTVLALVAWALNLPMWFNHVDAAAFTYVSDVISDSDVGAEADHLITFTVPSAIDDTTLGETIEVTFPLGFDLSGLLLTDVDIADDGTDITTIAANCLAANPMSFNVSGQTLVFQMCPNDGGFIATSSVVTIEVGTLATAGGAGANGIISTSTPGAYVVNVKTLTQPSGAGGIVIDEADTRIAIIDDVTVTATVDTLFSFTISGVDAGETVNDDTDATTATSVATSVPFGILGAGPSGYGLVAQELAVGTNAQHGFSVTVVADQTLTSGNGATIDIFADGVFLSTTTPWTSPTGDLGDDLTWGHWGITSDDNFVSGATSTLYGTGEALYRGDFVDDGNGGPVEVFYHNSPVLTTSGQGIGTTTVAYKAEITALQEAAKDYTATLTYVATPVF